MALSSISLHTNKLPNGENVLKRHVAFFDKNNDGVVYPWDTFKGLRSIGFGPLVSTFSTLIISVIISPQTRPKRFPSLLFPIEIKNINHAIHGSHTGAYDPEGRFVPEKFEEIFKRHAHTDPNALTKAELSEMRRANKEPFDIIGWGASFLEFQLLYSIAKNKNGLLEKETVRAVYDGSLFEQLEKERGSGKVKKTP